MCGVHLLIALSKNVIDVSFSTATRVALCCWPMHMYRYIKSLKKFDIFYISIGV